MALLQFAAAPIWCWMASTLAWALISNCQHIALVLYCYSCRVWHFEKLDFNRAGDQHIASLQLLLSKKTKFCLFQCQIECKVAILLSQMQLLAKYLPISIHNTLLACSANFWAGMLALWWSHLNFLFLLSLFSFFYFAMFFRFFVAEMTSNNNSNTGLTGQCLKSCTKHTAIDMVGFLKNFHRVLADFWPRIRELRLATPRAPVALWIQAAASTIMETILVACQLPLLLYVSFFSFERSWLVSVAFSDTKINQI